MGMTLTPTSPDESPPSAEGGHGRQPWVHELQIAVDGPATALSTADGQIGTAPGTGLYVDDRRVLSALVVTIDDEAPALVAAHSVGATSAHWLAARHLGDVGPDPTVEVHRLRRLDGAKGSAATLTEQITVTSRAGDPVTATLWLELAADGVDVGAVKGGHPGGPALPVVQDAPHSGREVLHWADDWHATTVTLDPPASERHTALTSGTTMSWPVRLEQGESWTLTVSLALTRLRSTEFDADAGSALAQWDPDAVADRVDDPRLAALLRTNLTDLRHLLLTDPDEAGDAFVAAGTPWYLTLFGRDSLWSARFVLPLSQELALGTLRTLARRQAVSHDVDAAAEPGKILHETRRAPYITETMSLPTVYYGTVDATPLWVVLLVETWRSGADAAAVRDLVPALQGALGWMADAVGRSSDGLLRYLDGSGHGLGNQGWKDSGDSMRRADGSIAPAPIALLEAQAYAVQAARGAADLLEALGEADGMPDWRAWADTLAGRVRDTFWVGTGPDRYLAMALDADGEQVDGVGSNMGHVLGTGLLTAEEVALVVDRMMQPDLLREFGIGTLSRDNPAYNPIGYHTGSVWTHDTAIAARGLWLEGYHDQARAVAERLLTLGTATGWRLPELCAGDAVGAAPAPYPASCRPQGWAAASAVVVYDVLTRP